jgi:HEAT repeat protein
MRSLFASFIAALALLGPARAQDVDLDKIELEPDWMPKKYELAKELDKKIAKEHVNVFTKALKAKDKKDRIAAIDALLKTGRNEVYVAPLTRCLKDRNTEVRVHAAQSLAKLGYRSAAPSLVSAFGSSSNRKRPTVRVAALDALGRVETKRSYFKKYRKVFEADDPHDIKAATLLFGHARDRKALPLLGKWLESPRPANPNSPSNPPASYWEKKFEIWQEVKREVEWAVWSITGELLETPDEVKQWIIDEKQRKRTSSKKKPKVRR